MTLLEILRECRPESHPRPQETWLSRARFLWVVDPGYMDRMLRRMILDDCWLEGPVIVEDGFVQDAHHRIVTAASLGWHDREIPVVIL